MGRFDRVKHRRDIDGLRALAVGGVVLGHAGVPFLPAGFVGVDVFFVISGFLIGTILVAQLEAGSFSLRAFYAKRIWRIFPALYVMVLATLLAGWFLLTPHELRYLGGAALAVLIFASNIWFYIQIDYFNPDAKYEPLLHTWSLGVEEQFYIVAPLFLLGLAALARARFGAGRRALRGLIFKGVFLAACVSFAYALWAGPRDAQGIFYLPFARGFELLLGVLAAVGLPWMRQPSERVRSGLVLLGALVILASYVVVSESALWPGPLTLVPVGATLLVLLFGGAELRSTALLGARPLAALGVISYSVYLWHQPLLSYGLIFGYDAAKLWHIVLFCAASLALAALSWKYVEQPFRFGALRLWVKRGLLWGLALAIVGFAVGGHVTKGYPGRMSPQVLAALEGKTSYASSYRRCIGGRKEGTRLDPAQACVHGADVAPRVAVWGDSHAAVLSSALGEALAEHGVSLRELTVGSCMPVLDTKNTKLKRTEYCAEHNRKMLDYILATPEIETVVLHAYWNSYTEWRDFETGLGWRIEDKIVALPLEGRAGMAQGARLAALGARYEAQMRALSAAGKRVIVLGPLPPAGFDAVEWRARALWTKGSAPEDLRYPMAAFTGYSALSWEMLARAEGLQGVQLLDLSSRLCSAQAGCDVLVNGVALHFDDNHLSKAGVARIVGPLAAAVLAPGALAGAVSNP